MLGGKLPRQFDRKGEIAAVEKFYAGRDYAPLWTQGGIASSTAKGVMSRLKDAGSEGLDAADYPVPDFTAASTPDALAEAELKLTASLLDYARQAQSGRMHRLEAAMGRPSTQSPRRLLWIGTTHQGIHQRLSVTGRTFSGNDPQQNVRPRSDLKDVPGHLFHTHQWQVLLEDGVDLGQVDVIKGGKESGPSKRASFSEPQPLHTMDYVLSNLAQTSLERLVGIEAQASG